MLPEAEARADRVRQPRRRRIARTLPKDAPADAPLLAAHGLTQVELLEGVNGEQVSMAFK